MEQIKTNQRKVNDVTLVTQVFKTKNYDLFNFIDGNRDINNLHVKRLQDSFRKKYLINPIIVNENYEIIDGQNRFKAAQEEKNPIYFIVVDGYGLEEVQLLNMNQSNWTSKDYLESYAELRYPDYQKCKDFWEEYSEFSLSAILALLTFLTGTGRAKFHVYKNREKTAIEKNNMQIRFKEGNFKIVDLNKSKEYADNIRQIGKYYSGYNRTVFVRTMVSLFANSNYDHQEFIKKLESGSQNHLLDNYNTIGQYKEVIEKIYNYKRKQENKVTLRDL